MKGKGPYPLPSVPGIYACVTAGAALRVQIGEIKKGLKALKATGVTPEDYQRHVMFVQVGNSQRSAGAC